MTQKNKYPISIANPTIQQVFNKFIEDQKNRLSEKSYKKYEGVIYLYESYMNGYAHQSLTEKEREFFEDQYNNHNREFCELFGPEKILDGYNEFFGYFLPKKVIAGQEFFKSCGTVLKKLAKWLDEKGYAVNNDAEEAVETSAKGGKDVASADKIGGMLYRFAQRVPPSDKLDADDDDFIESYFIIHEVGKETLYLMDFESPLGDIYTVKVPAELAGHLKVSIGWQVWLELVRTYTKGKEEWKITEVGNVYPM